MVLPFGGSQLPHILYVVWPRFVGVSVGLFSVVIGFFLLFFSWVCLYGCCLLDYFWFRLCISFCPGDISGCLWYSTFLYALRTSDVGLYVSVVAMVLSHFILFCACAAYINLGNYS